MELYLVTVFILCLDLPAAHLRSFLTVEDCGEQGTECVHSAQCQLNSRVKSSKCPENKICCLKEDVEKYSSMHYLQEYAPSLNNHSAESHSQKASYLRPQNNSPSYSLLPNMEYSVDDQSEKDTDTRIVNVELLNNTLDVPVVTYTKTTSSNRKEDYNIVFPEQSEEETDDRIKHIKKLYQKYAMDFKKYNSEKTNELSKTRFNFVVGYRSAKYCKLYERYSLDESLYAIPLLPSLFPVLMQNNHCSKPLPLIVGGINTSKGEFPHMAGLGYDRGEWIDFLCGGSMISDRYVLTAAHCAHTKWGPPIMVRLGTRNLITDEGQNMDVEQVIIHPDYKEPSCYNDIALVKMAPGVRMSSTLRPACLPPWNTLAGEPGSFLIATGWGRTGYGLFSSPNLQKVTLKVMDNSTCDQLFLGGRRTERLPSGIQDSMLCAAGYLDSFHDTCQGDSGGPLQSLTRHSKCMYEVVGITSFGKLCGTGLPAIYTRVSEYVPWIEEIVWPS